MKGHRDPQTCDRYRRRGRSVFGLCHLLGFRFALRIRDLGERRLYAMSDLTQWRTLRPLIAGPVNLRAIEEDWDETLRLAASIRAGTVEASVMLRKLAGYSCQNLVARALREIGRVPVAPVMLTQRAICHHSTAQGENGDRV